jgi:hypothetical protein
MSADHALPSESRARGIRALDEWPTTHPEVMPHSSSAGQSRTEPANFRMRRKPGVEQNDGIGHFDDMPTLRADGFQLLSALGSDETSKISRCLTLSISLAQIVFMNRSPPPSKKRIYGLRGGKSSVLSSASQASRPIQSSYLERGACQDRHNTHHSEAARC